MNRTRLAAMLIAAFVTYSVVDPASAYYRSKHGRFLSRDPIGVTGGLNPMRFAINNPVLVVDPLGLQSKPADPDSTTVTRGLGRLCEKECKCRCACESPTTKATLQSSRPADEKDEKKCLSDCKKGCAAEVKTIQDSISEMKKALENQIKTDGTGHKPSCTQSSYRLQWNLKGLGASYLRCQALLLLTARTEKNITKYPHVTYACSTVSCPPKTLPDGMTGGNGM